MEKTNFFTPYEKRTKNSSHLSSYCSSGNVHKSIGRQSDCLQYSQMSLYLCFFYPRSVQYDLNLSFYRKIFLDKTMHKSYHPILPTSNRILQKKWDDKYYSEHRILVTLSLDFFGNVYERYLRYATLDRVLILVHQRHICTCI